MNDFAGGLESRRLGPNSFNLSSARGCSLGPARHLPPPGNGKRQAWPPVTSCVRLWRGKTIEPPTTAPARPFLPVLHRVATVPRFRELARSCSVSLRSRNRVRVASHYFLPRRSLSSVLLGRRHDSLPASHRVRPRFEARRPPSAKSGEDLKSDPRRGVEDHLAALARRGVIRRETGKSRSIGSEGRPDFRNARVLPLLGRIAAAMPALAVEHHEDQLVLDVSG